ncbi:META domain-containing protein [Spirosoma validum]|uniref:META domain-containing protein n=1 Tax=Spirosoma validum TaxID=2771355 RepID=A0A927GBY0_9BACT|nr:META domain-containing protein [Spirosoma validum]MBD2752182.1 META domain-containing protein [Spirosoma validum]
MKALLLMAALFASTGFSGCEREKPVEPTPTSVQDLVGTWTLVEPNAYKVTLVIDPIPQTTQLPSPLPTFNLSGESAVNQYNSVLTYQASNQSQIAISPIGSTKKAGPSEAMQFEQTYYTNLKAVNRYELTNQNRLRFYYDGGVLVYEK